MSSLEIIGSFWFDRDEFDCFTDLHTKEYWFHAGQVCKILGFSNPRVAINTHTDDDERQLVDTKSLGKLQDTWYISESGLYALILASKTDMAKSFKRWLRKEVLPSIRKNGGYISPDATKEQLANLKEDINTRLASLETSFKVAQELGDDRLMIAVKAQLANLNDKINGKPDTEHEGWLTVSEIMGQKYALDAQEVYKSFGQASKLVKQAWRDSYQTEPYETPKHLASGHTTKVALYPPEFFTKVEATVLAYWTKKDLLEKAIKR